MVFKLLAILLFSFSANADEYFVEKTIGPGIAESDLSTATELIRVSVGQSGSHHVSKDSSKADFILRPRLMKLGSAYIMTLEKLKGEEVVFSNQLKASQLDELDKITSRLTRSVIESLKSEKEAKVGEVTDEEAKQGSQRKPAIRGYYFGIGPVLLGNLGSSGLGYDLSGAYAWDVNQIMVQIFTDLAFKGSASFLDIGIGGHYFLSDRDLAPYLAADFGYAGASVQNTLESSGGFALGFGAGFQLLRTSSIHLELGTRFTVLFNKNSIGNPTLLQLRLGLYF